MPLEMKGILSVTLAPSLEGRREMSNFLEDLKALQTS
ncbi:hypothetical protein ACVW2L_003579 [Mucilaginibacter sp. HD30]